MNKIDKKNKKNKMALKKFNGLAASSKFAICGLPIRVDTYKTCAFGCKYCFAQNRKIMEFDKELQVCDIEAIRRRLLRIKSGNVNNKDFLDVLIANNVTWHCGGMSDPFQPIENELGITKKLVELSNEFGIHILFSTKSDTVYDCDINPELHSFQLSVTNVDDNQQLEPGVPLFEKRVEFYKALKERGFKVGIRIQPFIPGISDERIIDAFPDADHFTIEGLKLVPQNAEHKKRVLEITGLDISDFKQMGLLNMKPEIREGRYKPMIEKLERQGLPYSIADNDMHYLGNSKCCCGDALVHKSTTFNNTAMCKKYGIGYSKRHLDEEIAASGCCDCKCKQLFTSNRQEGCETVQDFFDKRFDRKSSPFSPKFLYRYEELKENKEEQ